MNGDPSCTICHGSGVVETYGGHGTVLEIECREGAMTIEEAVQSILGEKTARLIIEKQGIHWAVIGAMAAAAPGTKNDPAAIATINKWNAEQKAALQNRS